MLTSRAVCDLTSGREANDFAAFVAAETACITDFTASIQAGLVILAFKGAEIQPGLVRRVRNHVDKAIFYQRQVKAKPVL